MVTQLTGAAQAIKWVDLELGDTLRNNHSQHWEPQQPGPEENKEKKNHVSSLSFESQDQGTIQMIPYPGMLDFKNKLSGILILCFIVSIIHLFLFLQSYRDSNNKKSWEVCGEDIRRSSAVGMQAWTFSGWGWGWSGGKLWRWDHKAVLGDRSGGS